MCNIGTGFSRPQGAALASMAGLMTYGRRQFEHLDATMRRLIPPFHEALAELTELVDTDAQAFEGYLVSTQRPGGLGVRVLGDDSPGMRAWRRGTLPRAQ